MSRNLAIFLALGLLGIIGPTLGVFIRRRP